MPYHAVYPSNEVHTSEGGHTLRHSADHRPTMCIEWLEDLPKTRSLLFGLDAMHRQGCGLSKDWRCKISRLFRCRRKVRTMCKLEDALAGLNSVGRHGSGRDDSRLLFCLSILTLAYIMIDTRDFRTRVQSVSSWEGGPSLPFLAGQSHRCNSSLKLRQLG